MQFAEKFGISERTARNYCASGKIEGGLAKQLHLLLKTGTSDSRKDWFAVGEYKRLANQGSGGYPRFPCSLRADTPFPGR